MARHGTFTFRKGTGTDSTVELGEPPSDGHIGRPTTRYVLLACSDDCSDDGGVTPAAAEAMPAQQQEHTVQDHEPQSRFHLPRLELLLWLPPCDGCTVAAWWRPTCNSCRNPARCAAADAKQLPRTGDCSPNAVFAFQ